jgi:hypothetical protein
MLHGGPPLTFEYRADRSYCGISHQLLTVITLRWFRVCQAPNAGRRGRARASKFMSSWQSNAPDLVRYPQALSQQQLQSVAELLTPMAEVRAFVQAIIASLGTPRW